MQTLKLGISSLSKAGKKHENQDALIARIPDNASQLRYKGALLAIADGVSACSEARKASHTAIASFTSDYYSTPDSWSVRNSAAKVLNALNRWLYQQGHQDHRETGSWYTTFTAIIIRSNTAHIIHTGDSRAWRLRVGQLDCLTRDHTASMGGRQFLGRALGMSPDIEIDYRMEPVEEGDLLLLTTDGIHDFLSEQEIVTLVKDSHSLVSTSETLVDKALNAGSTDNVSCILCHIDQLPGAEQEEHLHQLAQLNLPPDLYPGQTLDGYRILESLHASKRSQLYLAEHPDDGKMVVLKTPSVNYEDDPEYLEGFIREESIGRRITHPSIMKILPPRPGCRFLYHACEYIEGQTLREWMQDHPVPELADVRHLVRQIISAVRGLHRQQILHQDLKPENLMMDSNGRIRLIDFGAAHIAGEPREPTAPSTSGLPGTKNYMAPEYFLDGTIGEHSDQFSIGVITYELLTGALPYPEHPGDSVRIRHYQHLRYRRAEQLPDWINGTLARATTPPTRQNGTTPYLSSSMT